MGEWMPTEGGNKGVVTYKETVVRTTTNCEVVLTAFGFYARCTTPSCGWVTETMPSKYRATALATKHDES